MTTTGLTISDVLAAPGLGAFFFDDQSAIKAGAVRDGATYAGTPVLPGFRAVREPSESVSVMLILSDGYIAKGDCASVQYSGAGGREPRMHAVEMARIIETELAPALRGMNVNEFRAATSDTEQMIDQIPGLGRPAAYGLSQALLDAAAHAAGHHLMARVIQQEWQLPRPLAAVPVYGQTGEDRYNNVDKMILKSADVIPHGLINTAELVGPDGKALQDYISWLVARVAALRPAADYLPVLHLDVYGLLGEAVGGSLPRLADLIGSLESAAGPHRLRIEHPLDAGNRDNQINKMRELRELLRERGSNVAIIADEWANTADDIHAFAESGAADMIQIKTPDLGSIDHAIDAILDCQDHLVGAILGGTCAETDQSARACVHIGIATGVDQLLAKPGMGFDEGFSIVTNEMKRALRLDKALPTR